MPINMKVGVVFTNNSEIDVIAEYCTHHTPIAQPAQINDKPTKSNASKPLKRVFATTQSIIPSKKKHTSLLYTKTNIPSNKIKDSDALPIVSIPKEENKVNSSKEPKEEEKINSQVSTEKEKEGDIPEIHVVKNSSASIEEDLPSSIASDINYINKGGKEVDEKEEILQQLGSLSSKKDEEALVDVDIEQFIANPRKNSIIEEKKDGKPKDKKKKEVNEPMAKFKNLFKGKKPQNK